MRLRRTTALLGFTLGAVAATALLARLGSCRPMAAWFYLWPVAAAAWGFGLVGALAGSAVAVALAVCALGITQQASLFQFAGVFAVGALTSVVAGLGSPVTLRPESCPAALFPWNAFIAHLRSELARCYRYHRFLALVAIDLDHFGDVEHALGRPEAEAILNQLADTLAGWLRRFDFATRARAGEFIIALPELSRGAALAAAERLRNAIAEGRWMGDHRLGMIVTASAGVASFPRDAHNESDLIDTARLALAEAKRRGRDRAVALGDSRLIKAAS